jgi:hypothetical protein
MILITALATVPAAGAAQDAELQRCAELYSDAQRLACFDAYFERQQEGTESASDAAQPAPVAVTEAEVADEPSPTPPAAQAEAAEVPPPRKQDEPSASAPAAQAGASAAVVPPPRDQGEPPPAERERPKEYTATVVAMRERPHGEMIVRLDNGEVWSEQFASRAFLVNVGDKVTMKRGRFSKGYRLVAPGGRGYQVTLLDQ